MKLATLLIVALLLAGCSNPSKPPSSGTGQTASSQTGQSTSFSESETSAVPCPECNPPLDPPRSVELTNCRTYYMSFPADSDKAQAHMPSGYSPAFSATLALDSFVCERATIGNTTVIHDVQWFTVEGVVDVPPGQNNPTGDDLFDYESCMNSPDLRQVFALHGFEVCDGSLEMAVDSNMVTLSYRVADAVRYQYQSVGEADEPLTPRAETLRIHQGNGKWYSISAESVLASAPGEAGILNAAGGVIPEVWLGAGGHSAARGGIGIYNAFIEFEVDLK